MEDFQGPFLTSLFKTDRKMDTTNTRHITHTHKGCQVLDHKSANNCGVCVGEKLSLRMCVFTFSTFPNRVCNRRREATDSDKYLAWFPLECLGVHMEQPTITPQTHTHTHTSSSLSPPPESSRLPSLGGWGKQSVANQLFGMKKKKAMDAVTSLATITGDFTGGPCLV